MLTIEVKVNGRTVARATAQNQLALADISDYLVIWSEMKSAETGLPERANQCTVRAHSRRQSVWALVKEIAVRATSGRDILGAKDGAR